MRYDALISKLNNLREKYERDIRDLLNQQHVADKDIAAEILKGSKLPNKPKRVHWTQTEKGKKVLAARREKKGKAKKS